ncbi:hypothetical protein EGJ15_02785 [Pseudomonas sp. p99-361]|nr:hypothetical protein EGJ15_02785 [Pseudomonas sp. p99-361]
MVAIWFWMEYYVWLRRPFEIRSMTREFKILLGCNLVTLVVAAVACYFAFAARQEAKVATFAAEWGSTNAASQLDELTKVTHSMASDLELISAEAKAKASVDRLIHGY